MKLPLYKFCDLVYQAMMEGRPEAERARLDFELTKPDPRPRYAGRKAVKKGPTQAEMDQSMADMMAFGASMKG